MTAIRKGEEGDLEEVVSYGLTLYESDDVMLKEG